MNIYLGILIQNSCVPLRFPGLASRRMSSSRSKLSLLLYGILLCGSFTYFPVFSSKRQTIRSAGSLVWASGSSWDKREVTARDGEYLLGIKRLRRLYCNVGIGFHIQVLPNGKITGVHNENRYSKYFTIPCWIHVKQANNCVTGHNQLVYKFNHFYAMTKAKTKPWVTWQRIVNQIGAMRTNDSCMDC